MRSGRVMRLVAVLLGLALPAVAAAEGAPQYANWTGMSGSDAVGSFLGGAVTLSGTAITGAGSTFDGSATWFAGADYSPALPASDAVAFYGYTANSYTLTFVSPVKDPVLYLYSLASAIGFPAGTQVTRVSGDGSFAVSGSAVSGTLGGNSAGGDSNGVVRLEGTFSSIPFTANKTYGADTQDGIYLQIGAPLPPAPRTTISLVPASPTAAEYYLDAVAYIISAAPGEPGRPVETRCALDPFPVPDSFADLPATGCPLAPALGAARNAGRHTLYAASRDLAGSDETPLQARSFIVAKEPDTAITDGPAADTWDPTLRFTFTSTLPGSTFECRFDADAFAPCATPFTHMIGLGFHRFEVRAIGPDGAPDPSPAARDVAVRGLTTYGDKCEVRPVGEWPWASILARIPELSACEVVQRPEVCPPTVDCAPQDVCARTERCTFRDRTCPEKTRCRVTTTMHWFDADPVANWEAFAFATFGPYRTSPPSGSPRSERSCTTGADGDRCTARATVSALGEGQPPRGRCGLGANPRPGSLYGVWVAADIEPLGPNSVRRIECAVDFRIDPLVTLDAVANGTTVQVLAIPGVLDLVVGIITGGSGSAHAARTGKPAFAKIRRTIAKEGPVSITLKPNAAARRMLQRRGKLAVRAAATITGSDGKKTSRTHRLTLTPPPSERALCIALRTSPKKGGKPKRCA